MTKKNQKQKKGEYHRGEERGGGAWDLQVWTAVHKGNYSDSFRHPRIPMTTHEQQICVLTGSNSPPLRTLPFQSKNQRTNNIRYPPKKNKTRTTRTKQTSKHDDAPGKGTGMRGKKKQKSTPRRKKQTREKKQKNTVNFVPSPNVRISNKYFSVRSVFILPWLVYSSGTDEREYSERTTTGYSESAGCSQVFFFIFGLSSQPKPNAARPNLLPFQF